jgi:hypothetical protein
VALLTPVEQTRGHHGDRRIGGLGGAVGQSAVAHSPGLLPVDRRQTPLLVDVDPFQISMASTPMEFCDSVANA